MTSGSSRCGAAAAILEKVEENWPKTRCWLRRSISQKVAMSQKQAAPPLPRATS
jgi:hypothetical protein